MTTEEWVAKQLATAPPLTQKQQEALRRILARPAHKKPA